METSFLADASSTVWLIPILLFATYLVVRDDIPDGWRNPEGEGAHDFEDDDTAFYFAMISAVYV